MESIALKNFRCFADTGNLPLRPLTILVGENSTGKSSFLAAIRLAWDLANSAGIRQLDFNEEPFLLGAFDQIAHFRGGKAGRANSFSIRFETRGRPIPEAEEPAEEILVSHSAEFRRSGSHPVVAKQSIAIGRYQLTATLPDEPGRGAELGIRVGRRRTSRKLDERRYRLRFSSEAPIDWPSALYSVEDYRDREGSALAEKSSLTRQDVRFLERAIFGLATPRDDRPVAVAPVRTRPQRTYNPVSERPLPEGEHVPMVMAKMFFEKKARWVELKKSLDEFGRESGLFTALEIKALGRHESDPFQIRVKTGGPAANLVDVGYGVSQVLPILVDALLAGRGDTFLLQQPEVHLHPRAQAALGTFLGDLVHKQKKRFVIETHSDFLLDRIRMDVREGNIRADAVSILFFERRGIEVGVSPISVDSNGNLQDVPPSYRAFFLQEERRLLDM